MADSNPQTEIEQAIDEAYKNRPVVQVDVSGFFNGPKPVPRLGIRIPTKLEQDRAWIGAQRYVNEISAGVEHVAENPELVQDARAAHIAFEFCRELKEVEPGKWEPTGYPAFTMGPKWLCERLNADQFAVLLNLGNEVRNKYAVTPLRLSDGAIEVLVDQALEAEADELPEGRFAACSREFMVYAFMRLARLYREARSKSEPVEDSSAAPV